MKGVREKCSGWKQQKATSNGISDDDDEASISKGSQEDLSFLNEWKIFWKWLFEIGHLTIIRDPRFSYEKWYEIGHKNWWKKFTQIGTSAKIFKESTNCLLNYQGKEKGAGICVILSDHYLQKKTSNCS